jgi:hypothetical protein
LCLLALGGIAALDFVNSERVRQTFVFYIADTGTTTVEERLLYREPDTEKALQSYLQETLYGPLSPDLSPLFLPETLLLSVMYREGELFVHFSDDAAFPLNQGLATNLRILEQGIKRNFPVVTIIHIFIAGHEIDAG